MTIKSDQSDRELLELAAKAAGLPVNFRDRFGESNEVNGWWPFDYDESGGVVHWWNPLKDGGDALRLAENLKIKIGFNPSPYAEIHSGIRFFGSDRDGYASIRLAIVRAAAELGRVEL